MNFITTTQLRTKTRELTRALSRGEKVKLVHRSRIVGTIEPDATQKKPLSREDIKKLKALFTSMKPKKLIPRNKRDYYYRKHLMEKHGKHLS